MISLRRAVQQPLAAVVSLVVITACTGESTNPLITPQMARTTSIAVKSAEPSFGAQGQQHLSVRILGSGYDPSAVARWERNGVVDTKITVHSTTYVSSTELRADISIAPDADTTLYDVTVIGDNGRKKGVGVELFEVGLLISLDSAVVALRQAVQIGQDDAARLVVQQGFKTIFTSRHNFANTIAAGTDSCRITNSERTKDQMLALLSSGPVAIDNFGFHIDRTAINARSIGHRLMLIYGSNTVVRLRVGPPETDEIWVNYPDTERTLLEQIGPSKYRLSGGVLRIQTNGTIKGKGSYHTVMYCPNRDVVEVTYPENP
jgi:hypothetical protein